MNVSIMHEFFPVETGPGRGRIHEQRYYDQEASRAKPSKITTRRRRTLISIDMFEPALQPVRIRIRRD